MATVFVKQTKNTMGLEQPVVLLICFLNIMIISSNHANCI